MESPNKPLGQTLRDGTFSVCDSPQPPSQTQDGTCRCMICSRCKHHGNNNQGHYWAWCEVTRTNRAFHFCCPDDCELEEKQEER